METCIEQDVMHKLVQTTILIDYHRATSFIHKVPHKTVFLVCFFPKEEY